MHPVINFITFAENYYTYLKNILLYKMCLLEKQLKFVSQSMPIFQVEHAEVSIGIGFFSLFWWAFSLLGYLCLARFYVWHSLYPVWR